MTNSHREEVQARRERRDAAADREETVDNTIRVAGVFMLVSVIVGLVAKFNVLSLPVYIALSASDANQMHNVIYSGHPWLVLCHDSNGALSSSSLLADHLVESYNTLYELYNVNSAVMDCSETLPSGQTVYQRLKLETARSPVLFFSHGGRKPFQLNPIYASPHSTEKQRGVGLTGVIEKQLLSRWKAKPIYNSAQLKKECTEKRSCGMVAGYSKSPSKDTAFVISQLAKENPMMRWTYINLNDIQFSMEKRFFKLTEDQENSVHVMAFRRVGTPDTGIETHFGVYDTPGHFTVNGLSSFLESFFSESFPSNSNRISKLPAIRKRKKKLASKTKKTKKKTKPAKKADKPQPKPKQPNQEKPAATPDAATTQQESTMSSAERERQRREQMDREQSQHFAQHVEDAEEVDGDEDYGLEDDDVVDLDDDFELEDDE